MLEGHFSPSIVGIAVGMLDGWQEGDIDGQKEGCELGNTDGKAVG